MQAGHATAAEELGKKLRNLQKKQRQVDELVKLQSSTLFVCLAVLLHGVTLQQ